MRCIYYNVVFKKKKRLEGLFYQSHPLIYSEIKVYSYYRTNYIHTIIPLYPSVKPGGQVLQGDKQMFYTCSWLWLLDFFIDVSESTCGFSVGSSG